MSDFQLLESVNDPADLRRLKPKTQLPQLADELRRFLIRSVSMTGGHLAPSLGTVELTIALHYVFNTPHDKLVWDVGHQSYGHKILTGRRERMASLRQWQGLAGFPKRYESPYDAFDVGHASTSISAALGMVLAARNAGEKKRIIPIIGDGAMTAGMAFEALNHAGDLEADILVILNDNKMSISENVGGLSKYLAKLIAGKFYLSVRRSGKRVLKRIPRIMRFARRWEEHMKGMALPGTLFEEMGFNYIGPIDGHDLPGLIKVLENVREVKGPQFLHVVTQKGKGYEPAESDPKAYHGVSTFDPRTGKSLNQADGKQTYTKVFSQWLCDQAESRPNIAAITPAMCEGSGLVEFAKRHPQRYFDVGIAEQHAVTLAAGLACEKIRPVVAIYSTFLQRAYDQLLHDVALQNLPVVFAVDRAGLVGPDGPTHAGNYDISYLRCVPNLVIMAPASAQECSQMLSAGLEMDNPSVVRYPRDYAPAETDPPAAIITGKGRILKRGTKVAILAFGSMVEPARQVAAQLNATLVNMRFIKPLDEKLVAEMAAQHDLLVTVEENSLLGGAGSAVSDYLADANIKTSCLRLGIPDAIIEQGSRKELLEFVGLDANGIMQSIRHFLSKNCVPARSRVIS